VGFIPDNNAELLPPPRRPEPRQQALRPPRGIGRLERLGGVLRLRSLGAGGITRTRRDISPLANGPERPLAGRLSLICCGMASGSNIRKVASMCARSA
jgi:hypothetical protein